MLKGETSTFFELPQYSQLFSKHNCWSYRTGRSAKDLICKSLAITICRILWQKHIHLWWRVSYTGYLMWHTFVVWGEPASSLYTIVVCSFSLKDFPHLQLIRTWNIIPNRLCVRHMQSRQLIGLTTHPSISLLKQKCKEASDICNPWKTVATTSEAILFPAWSWNWSTRFSLVKAEKYAWRVKKYWSRKWDSHV